MEISFKEDINSLSYFKAHFATLLQKLKKNKRPFIITQNGKSAGIFMDIDTWERYLKKLNLLKLIYEGEMSLKEDKTVSFEEAKNYFKKKYSL